MARDDDEIRVFGRDGVYESDGLSQPDRSLVGQHWNAVERYLNTGRTDDYLRGDGKLIHGLDFFEGFVVDGVELATNTNDVDYYYMTGELDQGPYLDDFGD